MQDPFWSSGRGYLLCQKSDKFRWLFRQLSWLSKIGNPRLFYEWIFIDLPWNISKKAQADTHSNSASGAYLLEVPDRKKWKPSRSLLFLGRFKVCAFYFQFSLTKYINLYYFSLWTGMCISLVFMWSQCWKMESSIVSSDKFLPCFTQNSVAAAVTVEDCSGGLQLQTVFLPLAAFYRALTPGPRQPTAYVQPVPRQNRRDEVR